MRFRVILPILIYSIITSYAATDSTRALFEQGIATWDSTLLRNAFVQSTRETPLSDFLFKATCLWRIQVLFYIDGSRREMISTGKLALEMLDSAANHREDAYRVAARRANVCMILASAGITNGTIYGPRIAKYLEEMQKINAKGFDTRFIDAVSLLEKPSFVGGDPKLAQIRLQELYNDFSDSAAVAINLARAMIKNKQKAEARNVLDQVLRKDPANRWAMRVRKEVN
jgi:hypothetical protein